MQVFWHHDCGVKLVALSVIVQTVLQNGVAGVRRERIVTVLAEGNEESSSCRLVVRELAAVFVHPFEAHVGRTLLPVAFDLRFHSAIAN